MRLGSGPKPKAVTKHRRNRLMLNFTDAELKALKRAAEGEKPAMFARQIVLRFLDLPSE